jgi:hypothetical protein
MQMSEILLVWWQNQRTPRMAKLDVRVAGPRPDFRLVLAFVWGDAETDTEGNSRNAASREWTELWAVFIDLATHRSTGVSPVAFHRRDACGFSQARRLCYVRIEGHSRPR